METMFGPVLLPKIYAKGLSALEIASSGSIVLSVNDFETLHIENDEITRETKFQSQSNYWLSLQPKDVYRTVAVGDHTWSSEDDYQVMRTTNPEGYKMEGDLRIEGAVSFSNDLSMDSDMNLLGSAFIKGILSVNSNVFVESKVELGDTLSVEQEAIFADTLSVAETVYLSSNLSVEGHAWIEGGVSIGSNLSVEKEVIFSDTLSVSKEVYLSSNLSVEGRGWIEGAVELGDTLSVKDYVYLSSNLSVHGEVFLNSNLSVQGNLTVLDWVELDSTLSVLDAVTFSDTLSIGKEVYLSSNLSVADIVYLASNLEVVGDVRVYDEAFFNGTVLKVPTGTSDVRPEAVNRYTGSIFYNEENKRFEGLHDLDNDGDTPPQWMALGGVADVDGDTYVKAEETPGKDDDHLQFFAANAITPRMIMNSNLLSVNLELVVASNLSVGLDVVFADTLSVADAVTFADTLSVGELVYLSSHLSVEGGIDVMSNVFLDSALSVKGETDIVDRVQMGDTLSVFKEAYLHSNLSVGGEVEVIGASLLKDTLTVIETVYLNSNLSVGENLFVDLDLSVGVDLTVDNDTLIKRALFVESNVFMDKELSVSGKVELRSTLSVKGDTEMGGTLSVKSDVFIHHDSTLYTNKIMHGLDQAGEGELIIDVETLHVKGNLEIQGTTNTTNSYTTDMFVEDRAIVLATSSNYTGENITDPDYTEIIKDGLLTNDKSGIRVAGVPDDTSLGSMTSQYSDAYRSNVMWEKSFLWNFNEGMPELGYVQDSLDNETDTQKRDKEAFWELRGGAFHLSAQRFDSTPQINSLVTVKYGFRINAANELEIIQKLGEDPSRRVAKFGIGSAF
jgi:UDP-3-O-[3-hydroxymyristoyl] glucosamine N-acyltransferase